MKKFPGRVNTIKSKCKHVEERYLLRQISNSHFHPINISRIIYILTFLKLHDCHTRTNHVSYQTKWTSSEGEIFQLSLHIMSRHANFDGISSTILFLGKERLFTISSKLSFSKLSEIEYSLTFG